MKTPKGHNTLPLVSVVIPTYNSIRTIEKCLQSIKKQSYASLEVIVVDSPYYDETMQKKCKQVIMKYARYFSDGPERSIQRNRGIKEAKGEYIAMIDQDMYLSKNVIKDCVATIKKNNFVALTIPEISIGEGFWTECVALDRYVTTYLEKGENECCRFFSKKDAVKIGGYDTHLVGVEDADFHYRMGGLGKIGKSKEVIFHDEGKTDFLKRVKKKYYYSKAFRDFVKRNPLVATGQFFPIKTAYFKHWKILLHKPAVLLGLITLRMCEVAAGSYGLLFS